MKFWTWFPHLTEKTGVWKISIEINLFLYSSPTLSPLFV